MYGEFIGVWSETLQEIWSPMIDQEEAPDDLFCELYRELVPALREPSPEAALSLTMGDAVQRREAFDRALVLAGADVDLARRNEVFESSDVEVTSDVAHFRKNLEGALTTIIDDSSTSRDALSRALGELVSSTEKRAEVLERKRENIVADRLKSREAFENARADDIAGEHALVMFLEAAHGVFEDLGGDPLANVYFNLLARFIGKFNLRYDLRRPCILCPTLPGMFASLVGELHTLGHEDSELDELVRDFEEAVRDLRSGTSSGRIKTCIAKEVMLLEALASMGAKVDGNTLGEMCEQIGSWPHPAVRESLKKLYGFASDRSGIRHGKSQKRTKHLQRAMEMRDMVAVSVVLAGFAPYLTDRLDADKMYRGG